MDARSIRCIGRDADLERIERAVDAGPSLITLHGAPGVGKRHLALAAAERLGGAVRFARASRVGGELRVSAEPGFDDAGGIPIVVASRPLRAPGEVALLLEPLTVAGCAELLMSLLPEPVERDVALAVVEHLDGLPAAVVLAAESLLTMSAGDLVPRLASRVDVLEGWGERLAAALDELEPAERELVRAAASVSGSFSLDAAEVMVDAAGVPLRGLVQRGLVTFADGRYRLLRCIRLAVGEAGAPAGLVAFVRALVEPCDGPGEPARMHRIAANIDAVDAVLSQSLEGDAGERVVGLELVRSLGEWCQLAAELTRGVRWARLALPHARGDDDLLARLAEIFLARGDRAAAERALDEVADQPRALFVRGRLSSVTGDTATATRLLERALELDPDDRRLRLSLLVALGNGAIRMGDYDALARWAAEAEALAAAYASESSKAQALMLRFYVHRFADNVDLADTTARQAIAAAELAGDRRAEAMAVGALGGLLGDQGHELEGLVLLERSATLSRGGGDARVTMITALNIGEMLHRLGDGTRARVALGEAAAVARETGDLRFQGWVFDRLAQVSYNEADLAGSALLTRRSLQLGAGALDRRGVVLRLEAAAWTAFAMGRDLSVVALLVSTADQLHLDPPLPREDTHVALLAPVREALSQAGVSLPVPVTIDEAVNLGLGLLAPPVGPETPETPATPPPSVADPGRPALLRLRMLGDFQALADGERITLAAWKSKKARDLLKVLALGRGRLLSRDTLMDALWPGVEAPVASARLSVALSTLRAALGPARELIRAERGFVILELGGVDSDLETFHAHVEAGDLSAALDAYGGELLPGDLFEEWSVAEREAAATAYFQVCVDLAGSRTAEGRHLEAADLWRRALDRDSFDESAHRGVIVALSSAGSHGQARVAYDTYVDRMTDIGLRVPSLEAIRSKIN